MSSRRDDPAPERGIDSGVHAETTVSIDCHVHTRGSYDSSETLDAVLKSAVEAGLDGVVVTDHDCISYAVASIERAEALGLVGIPGVEISTADGHLLGIGIDTRPPAGLGFEGTVRRVRQAGGIAVVPHPFQRSRHGVSADTITDCDGVEVFNAQTVAGVRNRQAARFAAENGYPTFAGSDAHRHDLVGYAYTEVDIGPRPPTRENVLAAMRAGRVRPTGTRVPTSEFIRKLTRTMKYGTLRRVREAVLASRRRGTG